MNKKSSIINVDNNRIFIDIAKSGCGNGCKYCYVKTANDPQLLWSQNDITCALSELTHSERFVSNADKCIVSLCPSTEPLKSPLSCSIIKLIVETLAPFGCFIQIATKELVSTSFLNEINDILLFEGQLHINISFNCFTFANQVEPNAPKPEDRLNNIIRIRQFEKIKSCILIKPFAASTYSDISLFKKYIETFTPDFVCVGISFFKNHCINEKNSFDFFSVQFEKQDTDLIYAFINELSTYIGKAIYPSTLCIVNQFKKCFIVPNARTTILCNNCGKCIENEPEV